MATTIRAPRAAVVALFARRDNMHHWHPALVRIEPLRGVPGEVGSAARLVQRAGVREIEVVETVTKRDLPRMIEATYELPGAWSRVAYRFDEVDGERTRWEIESEYRCRGLMWLAALLMPQLFKRQTEQTMQRFKQFVEARANVAS